RRFAAKNGKSVRGFSPEALAALEDYAWPGNVRELEHAVERAVVLARGDVLDVGDLPDTVRKGPRGAAGHVVIPIGTPLEEVERPHRRRQGLGRPAPGHRHGTHLPEAGGGWHPRGRGRGERRRLSPAFGGLSPIERRPLRRHISVPLVRGLIRATPHRADGPR